MARNGTSELLKRARQQAIADLVRHRGLRTQRELAAALQDKGFGVAQATVSRDIAEMGLVKVRVDDVLVYALPPAQAAVEPAGEQRLRVLLGDLPIEIHRSGLLLVLRAVPGAAHAIASALDRAHWSEVLGTIAGDDTLFVACADEDSLGRVRKRLRHLCAERPSGRAQPPATIGGTRSEGRR
jgi:transcriptional regulator of arginine metabolism